MAKSARDGGLVDDRAEQLVRKASRLAASMVAMWIFRTMMKTSIHRSDTTQRERANGVWGMRRAWTWDNPSVYHYGFITGYTVAHLGHSTTDISGFIAIPRATLERMDSGRSSVGRKEPFRAND